MKKTLEYKILRFLSEKNNGRFLDVAEIDLDTEFLKSVLSDLKNRELILTEKYFGTPYKGSEVGMTKSDKPEKCKIKLKGLEYLVALEKTEVDFELAKQTLKEFPTTKWFARIGLFIAITLALKDLYILLTK
jgi:hypothetical protein